MYKTLTVRPASDKQVDFIRSLLCDRVVDPEHALVVNEMINGGMTMATASAIITALTRAPFRPRDAGTTTDFVTEDGMYRDPDSGTIYKVQFNRASGDGRRLYAKKLVIVSDATHDGDGNLLSAADVAFEYAAGAMRFIRPEWRMTLEQAKAFGALYGTCVRCGRTLTREESIERSMGPVCVKHFS